MSSLFISPNYVQSTKIRAWELVLDNPYYLTFLFGKLKMVVVISESEQHENGCGKYLDSSLTYANTNDVEVFLKIWIWKWKYPYPNNIILAYINNSIPIFHLSDHQN
jgi:hypothetical protein